MQQSTVRSITGSCQEPMEGQTLSRSLAPGEQAWAEAQPQPKQLHRERGETCQQGQQQQSSSIRANQKAGEVRRSYLWRGNASWSIIALGLPLDNCFLAALKPWLSG